MSEKEYEQSKAIRAKKTAFYESRIHNSKETPKVAVVKPIITSESIRTSVKFIDLSKEYILGLTKNGK